MRPAAIVFVFCSLPLGFSAIELVESIGEVQDEGYVDQEDESGGLQLVAEGGVTGVDDDPPADAAGGEEKQDGGDESGVVDAKDGEGGDVEEGVDEGEVDGDEAVVGVDEVREIERGQVNAPDAHDIDEDHSRGGEGVAALGQVVVHESAKAVVVVLLHLMSHVDGELKKDDQQRRRPDAAEKREDGEQKQTGGEACVRPVRVEPVGVEPGLRGVISHGSMYRKWVQQRSPRWMRRLRRAAQPQGQGMRPETEMEGPSSETALATLTLKTK